MTLSLYREAILVPASFALAVKMVEPLEFFPPHLSACVSKVSVINLNMERERERERGNSKCRHLHWAFVYVGVDGLATLFQIFKNCIH